MQLSPDTHHETEYDRPPGPMRGLSGLSLFLITLFSVPALQPLFNGRLTCGFDNVFHLWRAVEIEALWQNGVYFSRWAPHMAHGFGYPLYLFQSPLSAYLAAFLQTGGFSWNVALNIVYGLGILASGWTMWLLARDLWGLRGAFIAAVAYVYAPFHAYVAYYRASLSETVAWLFVPLILWGLLRWQGERKQRRGLATAVVSFVLLIVSHDVTGYAFLPFFLGWIGVLALTQKSWSVLGRGLLAVLLGIGGSAFFWLPALASRQFIHFERANSAWPFLYFNNFLPLDQLFALPRNADPSLLNDWPERGLGILLMTLAIAGALIAWKRQPHRRWLTGYLALALVGTIFMTVTVSRPLWESITILQVFQFPWRFMAPATLAAALLTGGIVFAFEPLAATSRRLAAIGLPLGLILFLSMGHWGWFYPGHCPAPTDTSLAGLVAWEEATDTLGTTAGRELLPITVERMPQDTYELPVWGARLARADLPEGVDILAATYEPLSAEISLDTAVPFTARYRTFYFPGWRVWLNDEPVEITPSVPDGLITFPVPAGAHTIRISFSETPLNLLANVLSLLAIGTLLFLLIRPGDLPEPAGITLVADQRRFIGWAFILAIGLLVLKLFVADAGFLPLRSAEWSDGSVTEESPFTPFTFGTPANPALVRLLGYDELPTAVAADAPLIVSLYWRALAQLDEDYRVGLALVDENGLRWTEAGLRDYRWTRAAPLTQSWPGDKVVQTAFLVDLLAGTPPGSYDLQLSLFERESLTPLTVYEEGSPIGPGISLGQVEVVAPQRPFTAASFTPQFPFEASEDGLQISGANVDRQQAAPGENVWVSLFWQNSAETDGAATVELLDGAGQVRIAWPIHFPPSGSSFYRQQTLLRLPASLDDGQYRWQIKHAAEQSAPFGSLFVEAPDRLFQLPPVDTAVEVTLYQDEEPIATLQGVDIDEVSCQETPASCPVSLVWQAETENLDPYRMFIQIVAADGRLLAQHDAEPANWQRPTTGWVLGEFIKDTHELDVSVLSAAEDANVIVGMYSPKDGRLRTSDGRDFILLSEFLR